MPALHCPTCSTPLAHEVARCGDPVLWCPVCQTGWLPGTQRFDRMLDAQHRWPEFPYLFQEWEWQDPPTKQNTRT